MRKVCFIFIIILILITVLPLAINRFVITSTENLVIGSLSDTKVLSSQEVTRLKEFDPQCILVLGAGLSSNGAPSPMLKDRLDAGISLYMAGVAPKLLLSGDHGKEYYDEVNAMKKYALEAGVPSDDLFLDYAGFSTYESMYRAKVIFKVKRMVIVTQRYHQYRALYTANGFGIESCGFSSDQQIYSGQDSRDIREFLARNKDFIQMLVKPEPTFLGPSIPITGNGVDSHD